MVVNNIEALKPLLHFDEPTRFYFIEILQRRKDNNDCESVNSNYRLIKVYYIRSLEELERRYPKIMELCESNNARAYLYLNVRDTVEISWNCLRKFTDLIQNNNTIHGYTVWDHSCGSLPHKVEHWVIDIDTKDMGYVEQITELILKCRGADNRIHTLIPTKNGYHLITGKFDYEQLREMCRDFSIDCPECKKDSPTLLYY